MHALDLPQGAMQHVGGTFWLSGVTNLLSYLSAIVSQGLRDSLTGFARLSVSHMSPWGVPRHLAFRFHSTRGVEVSVSILLRGVESSNICDVASWSSPGASLDPF